MIHKSVEWYCSFPTIVFQPVQANSHLFWNRMLTSCWVGNNFENIFKRGSSYNIPDPLLQSQTQEGPHPLTLASRPVE